MYVIRTRITSARNCHVNLQENCSTKESEKFDDSKEGVMACRAVHEADLGVSCGC